MGLESASFGVRMKAELCVQRGAEVQQGLCEQAESLKAQAGLRGVHRFSLGFPPLPLKLCISSIA